MESFGKILKTVREEKQIDIEQIASETSISKEYLLALEEENLDIIPGTTYTAGFLRNYSEYLGCDTKYLLSLYHAKMLQDTPTPPELLQIGKGPARIIIWSLVGVLVLAGLIFGGISLYKHLDAK
jgi:cytoskeletal protein RodZ